MNGYAPPYSIILCILISAFLLGTHAREDGRANNVLLIIQQILNVRKKMLDKELQEGESSSMIVCRYSTSSVSNLQYEHLGRIRLLYMPTLETDFASVYVRLSRPKKQNRYIVALNVAVSL